VASLYGESTEDSGLSSDATWYSGGSDFVTSDDESTLKAAEQQETRERRRQLVAADTEDSQSDDDAVSFVADAIELQRLHEESTMDIPKVLERLRTEAAGTTTATTASPLLVSLGTAAAGGGSEADDDMDASDVEDYTNPVVEADDNDDDGEFMCQEELDDETTLEQEEQLPPDDVTAEQEIALLQQENEMSLDELRERYQISAEGASEADPDRDSDENESSRSRAADRSDEEYEPEEAVDDETTMEAEEQLGREMSAKDEIDLLRRESEMPVEELRAMYAELNETTRETAMNEDSPAPEAESDLQSQLAADEDQENDEDFLPDEDIKDDEETMEAEEKLGREMSAEEEIALLQKESELPVEELRRMYQSTDEEEDSQDSSSIPLTKRKRSDESSPDGLKKAKHDDGIDAMKKLELSAESAWRTRASRPFLIPSRVKLREYQQIGLNWLVSLQSRRLNGILADGMYSTALM
jgi:hypothetical protein